MECRSNAEVDEYLYLDAKLLKGGDVAPKNRSPFQDAIVFVIGGGNYIEYQNLVDFIKVRKSILVVPELRRLTHVIFSKRTRRTQQSGLFMALRHLTTPSSS